jgi:hypothetical protein
MVIFRVDAGNPQAGRRSNALYFADTGCTSSRSVGDCSIRHRTDARRRIAFRVGRIMRDLTKRGAKAAPSCLAKGRAFDIADLVRIRSWADCHGCRMLIRLDHGANGEEYEEVIDLHAGTGSQPQALQPHGRIGFVQVQRTAT